MPMKPKKPCRINGCPNLTAEKYCDEHKHKSVNDRVGSAKRGYDGRWRKARSIYLKAHPFCVRCESNGKYEKATVIDHIVPHRGNDELFWNQDNWQPLCKRCHDKKTMTEDRLQSYDYDCVH